jgi:hypothetical protein
MNMSRRVGVLSALLPIFLAARVGAQTPTPAPAPTPVPATADAATSAPAPAIDPAKEAEIRKMLKLNGTEKLMVQMKEQMLATFRQRQSSLPPEFWDRMDKDMDVHELLEKMIPIYDKNYTLDDLKAANAFYESPAGQRIIASSPKVMAEVGPIAKQWGAAVGLKVMLEMQDYKQRMSTTPPASNATPAPTAPAPQ